MQANPYPITVALCTGTLLLGATETFQLSFALCSFEPYRYVFFVMTASITLAGDQGVTADAA